MEESIHSSSVPVSHKVGKDILDTIYVRTLTLPIKAENSVFKPNASTKAMQIAEPPGPDMT